MRFGRAELDGIGALVSNGFEPDRLGLEVRGGVMTVTASRPLWFGRWLNLRLVTAGTSKGFPPIRLRFGSIDLSPAMSRRVVDLLRYAANRRGFALPPLDKLVRSVTVGRDAVGAIIALPPRDMLANRIAKLEKDPVDSVAVKRLYCGLAAAQRRYPSDDLARHVNRAFAGAATQANPAAYNRAAFVALAMLLVDPRAGDLAGGAQAATASCRIEPVVVAIHGRADLSKHWALSAALSAGAGGQLAQALGEWKELADSLAQQSEFAVGDPTGFSFVDLSADRSGFTIAQAAADPDNAARIGALLARATPANILPEIPAEPARAADQCRLHQALRQRPGPTLRRDGRRHRCGAGAGGYSLDRLGDHPPLQGEVAGRSPDGGVTPSPDGGSPLSLADASHLPLQGRTRRMGLQAAARVSHASSQRSASCIRSNARAVSRWTIRRICILAGELPVTNAIRRDISAGSSSNRRNASTTSCNWILQAEMSHKVRWRSLVLGSAA